MHRQVKTQEQPRFELTTADGTHLYMNAGSEGNESSLATQKPKLRSATAGEPHGEKIVEIRQLVMNSDVVKMQENPQYEKTPITEHVSKMKGNDSTEWLTTVRASTKPQSRRASTGKAEKEKYPRELPGQKISQLYDGSIYEVIANNNNDIPVKQAAGGDEQPDKVYDTLNVLAQTMQQQMDLFRRTMCQMTLLLVITLLTAAVSLSLIIQATTSEKWAHQTPSPPGRVFPLPSSVTKPVMCEGGKGGVFL